MEFQSTTWSSTFTPVCFVYWSDRPCQNGRVWSLLYSAMTTLMDRGLPPELSPHAVRPSSATTLGSARARRPRRIIAAHTAARLPTSQQAASGAPSPRVGIITVLSVDGPRSGASSEFCYDRRMTPRIELVDAAKADFRRLRTSI